MKNNFYPLLVLVIMLLLTSNGCNDNDSSTDYGTDLSTAPTVINTLSKTSAMPASQLVITGSGFSSPNTLSVRFSNDNNYQVDVPVLQANSTSLIVSVPPYIISSSGQFKPDTVDIRIIKKSGSSIIESNMIKGLRILELPVSAAAPGTVTLNFLNWEIKNYINIQQEIQGTTMDIPSLTDAISVNLSKLQSLAANVKKIVQTPSYVFSFGSINGVTLNIGSKEILQCDRYILGMYSTLSSLDVSSPLHSQNHSSKDILSKLSITPCPSQALEQIEALQNPGDYTTNSHYDCITSSAPDAVATVYKVVAGAGTVALGMLALAGAPAIALALPAAAIIYATIMTSGMQITIGSSLKNVNNKAALAAIHNGVDQIEDMCIGMLVGKVLPNTAGAVKDMCDGFKLLGEAFVSSAPDCSYSLSEYSKPFISTGGSGSVSVIASVGCTWTATSGATWITVTSGSNGSGNGTVSYLVKANTSSQQRTGSIKIEDKNFTITQAGGTNQAGAYDGNWVGTFNGIHTYTSGSTYEYKNEAMAVSIKGTVVTAQGPILGTGSIDGYGNATWQPTSGSSFTPFIFTGTFTSGGSASGTWTYTIPGTGGQSGTGSGTWNMTKQ